jgi:hypothetical protein
MLELSWRIDDDCYGPPWEYASGIQNVVEAIAELLEDGFAAEVVELSEYALARVEEALEHDLDGTIGDISEELEKIHLKACKRAKPDPEALAKQLFDWELGSDHDTFFDALETYAEVLGERGIAEYGRLAEEEWADVVLAYRSGDVEAVVAVKSKDLSSPLAYLGIVRLYKLAGTRQPMSCSFACAN